jgi:hypothetical protein
MPERVTPAESPPLAVIAPFFLLAPVALAVAGFLALGAGREVFVAINTHRTVAMTHTLILGWVSLFLFGASYQLASAVLGGAGLRQRLARVQLVIHLAGFATFVTALMRWELWLMAVGGSLVVVSFLMFAWNVAGILRQTTRRSHPRTYMLVGLVFLVAGISVGLTFVGNFEHRWFAPSMGRLAAHAHLGLAGWMALTVMGVSYQLVPMFNIVQKVKPRVPLTVLVLTAGATVVFALAMPFDPPQAIRFALALGLAAGPALWLIDQLRLLFGRSRRKLDFHGQAMFVSLGFLALTLVLGLAAAWGGGLHRSDAPAALPLAYGAAGILGWFGTALIGNSYKILPFLIWFHRYRPRMGQAPVPLVKDLVPEWWPQVNLAVHAAGTVVIVVAALTAQAGLLHAGGVIVIASALVHLGGMAFMFLPKQSSRPAHTGIRSSV